MSVMGHAAASARTLQEQVVSLLNAAPLTVIG